MEKDLTQQKQIIRDEIESRRKRLPKEWIASTSRMIFDRLNDISEFRDARTLHCYVAWRNEVDTQVLIKRLLNSGRRVVVPVVDRESHSLIHSEVRDFADLQPGAFGILEPMKDRRRPVEISELDLIVVPGVAFDRIGNRIGYGGGYYDNFLKHTPTTKIGLAYDFQIVERIPTNARDERVDMVVSEQGVLRF
ncbi:5-formyltetrahydrofolate cyclo-ligase [candidate division KSB1 bacterium]|nr:5-formyltetrahydrofolate cyclo-ligase [candidate division KSB1 bacterium]NIS26045.1 5-formyltetrahydrofolate cyclo-ligase [candidate division KSB1 bacterium]NIU25680.1 5-formyltetrahydrofolate cyclo-ligase [candidate division KSB1 bacterium]NIU93426.1 5-formyltetrahydrofolate cyclo-ligase [candidate division KSB1 bacterium]NIW19531.1 5-formyltetrahydrofolate cyclo-ligase [candidate division KSB1 bacterium]